MLHHVASNDAEHEWEKSPRTYNYRGALFGPSR
jgi:hypothetical protein